MNGHRGQLKTCCRGFILGLALLWAAPLLRADQVLAMLEVGSQTYSNVTVTSKTPRYIVIMHAHGLTSIKLKELSTEVLQQLGYKVELPGSKSPKSFLPQHVEIDPRIKEMQTKAVEQVKAQVQQLSSSKLLWGVLAGIALFYFFGCYCCDLICKKTGQDPGVLVWIPILQTFPMLKAAGMAPWWFLAFLLPVVSVVASIVWCVKICQARGKSGWLAVLLLLPITNLFAFLYLAFADELPEGFRAQQRITFN